MTGIVTAVLTVGIIGLVCGIALAAASIALAVPTDEKAEAVTEMLPGANCGSCGYSGCAGYASALSQGKTANTALCNPGGAETSKKIAEYLGLAAGDVKPMSAVVLCQGNKSNASIKMDYVGVDSCKMAAQLFGGPKDCIYGCLGLGDCVKACPYNAIKICDGVARVNPALCKACKKCIENCPKGIIELLPLGESRAAVLCKNKDKGVLARKECKMACIGCMKCVKVCESGAVTVVNFNAHVDTEKCTGCGKCAESCPVKCINILNLA
ncbi:MAG: RnfABCDGE type electron transport complex subunit B [Clostridiales bacterium]|nr:RnfABCDGE type electron transport complex subunit B [Clostridiales bacterium]MCD7827338.1 RnfABCDGE type electron transport complex subunit B [Clostridiales bacterium]